MSQPVLCQKPDCRREMHLTEFNDHWCWQCLACGCVRLQSKPNTQARARLEVNARRQQQRMELQRRLTSRPKYMFLGANRAANC